MLAGNRPTQVSQQKGGDFPGPGRWHDPNVGEMEEENPSRNSGKRPVATMGS